MLRTMEAAGQARAPGRRQAFAALLTLAWLSPWPGPAAAQTPSAVDAGDRAVVAPRLQRLKPFLAQATGTGGYLGAVSLVALDGRVVDFSAYGHADLARSRPMRTDAIFRMYSMSKPIASVAALMLLEEGKLSLDDPVSRYLPELAQMRRLAGGTADAPELVPIGTEITVRHLLTHTAGFATGGEDIAEASELLERAKLGESPDLASFVRRLGQVPLASEPGTAFRYDGVNTEVLSRLVEVVGGERFGQFLERRIFAPLGMRDTGFEVPPAQRARVADLTTNSDEGRLQLVDTASAREPGVRLNAYDSGAGGLYSTAQDYFRFAQMLANGGELDGVRLLSRKTVELMMSDQLGGMDPPLHGFARGEGFGLGGYVITDVAARGRLGSEGAFGWAGAASTFFTIDRKERLVALLLLQHLPNETVRVKRVAVHRRLSTPFYNIVYQALP